MFLNKKKSTIPLAEFKDKSPLGACRSLVQCVGLVLLCQLSSQALAQLRAPQPDAGSIYKQIEQGLKLPTPSLGEERKPQPSSKELSTTELSVTVTKFNVLGNSLLSSEQVNEALAPYIGKALTFDDLQKVVQILVEQYKQSGWVVRAYLPKQEVGNGEIVIQVVEAKFGGALFENSGKRRVSEARMLAMVEAAQPKDKYVRSASVDRVLLLMDDLPGVNVSGNLTEGREEGTTDLLLKVVDKPLVNGFVALDNTGSASTGPNKLSSSVTVNSPLGLGDQFQTSVVRTTGSEYARASFSLPVGYDGMRAAVHYSAMNYMLVGSFANLGATGSVKDTGLDLTYPVLRSPAQNANLAFTQAHKILDNYANAVPTSTYTMDTSVVNYAMSSADEWSGGGFNSASLGISTGNVNLNGSVNQPSDAQTYRTEGHYWHSNINLSREQFLTEQTSGFISYGVQNANKNLDSSEKLYLGGASGVRAYPTNEGGGSAGQIASLEIRNKLDDRWTVTGFYDYGKIVQYQNNSDINGNSLSLNSPNTYELQGYGMSLEWKSADGTDLRATVAKRVAKNPAANVTTGMDSDGTYKNPHIWVVANVPF